MQKVTQRDQTSPRRRRFQPRHWLFAGAKKVGRVTAILLVAAACLLLTLYVAGAVLVNGVDLSRIVSLLIAEQTGGKLEIDRIRYDLLQGVNFEGMRFYPPDPRDPRGYIEGGALVEMPLIAIKELAFNYDIPSILFGRIHLDALQLIEPAISIRETDGVDNFSGIIAYRAKNFPAAKIEDHPAEVEVKAPFAIPSIPIHPKNIFFPFILRIKNVGIADLSLSFEKSVHGQSIEEFNLSGINLDIGADWQGRSSRLLFSLNSGEKNPLTANFLRRDPANKPQVFAVRTALSTSFAVRDLTYLDFDFDLNLLKMATPQIVLEGIPAHVQLRMEVNEDFRGINVGKFDVDLAEAFFYQLHGAVNLPGGTLDLIRINLEQSFNLDFSKLKKIIQPFLPQIDASGRLVLENLKIEGDLEPSKLGDLANCRVPFISARVAIEDVLADLPQLGVAMQPLNGTVALALSPNLAGSGYQLDSTIDVNLDQFTAKQNTPMGKIVGKIEDLSATVMTRALIPALVMPVAKINIEIPHIITEGGKLPRIDLPLVIDVDADADGVRNNFAADLGLALGELVAMKANIDCRLACQDITVGTALKLDSLESLYAMAYPVAAMLGVAAAMPSKLSGSVDMQFDAKGSIPNPMNFEANKMLADGNVRFNTQIELSDMNAEIPMTNTKISDFSTRLSLTGNLQSQKLNLRTGFRELNLEIPGGTPSKPMMAKIDRFDYDLTIKNQFFGKIDPAAPLASSKTAVGMNVYVGQIDLPGTIPEPVKGSIIELQAGQSSLRSVEVSKLELRLPDFGITAGLDFLAGLDPDFFPNSLLTNFRFGLDHGSGKDLTGMVRTAGKFDLETRVETKDMKGLNVQGKVEFKEFGVVVSGAAATDPKLIVVEDVRGRLPFKQHLDISEIVAGIKEPKPKDPASGTTNDTIAGLGTAPLSDALEEFFARTQDRLGKTANRAALVNYETLRPFYPEKSPIKVKRIEVANLELTDLEFDAELRQNIMAINQFVINFLGGKIQGDFQLSLDSVERNPKEIPKSIRTSLHVTRLNSHKLLEKFPQLKGKKGGDFLGSNPYIDATVHLKYDFASSDMDGGIEITSIGKEQMKMILYYVDPNEQNSTIGDIRTALNIGDVRLVSIPLKNGEVGLDVDVRLLGAPLPVPKLSKIPISQIVRNITGASESLDEGTRENIEEFSDEDDLPKI